MSSRFRETDVASVILEREDSPARIGQRMFDKRRISAPTRRAFRDVTRRYAACQPVLMTWTAANILLRMSSPRVNLTCNDEQQLDLWNRAAAAEKRKLPDWMRLKLDEAALASLKAADTTKRSKKDE